MPRGKLNKLYRTFVKGLITEASPLTYPEDASIAELNTILSRKGNRSRRKGIRYEEGFVMNSIPSEPYDAISEFVWHSVAKINGKAVIVVQVGNLLHFWDMDGSPLSDHKLAYTINLDNYKAGVASTLDLQSQGCMFSSGAGYLFVTHPLCDPIVVEYSPVTDSYTAVRVVIQIRDFEGVYDGLANDEEPTTLSNEHHYNLKNQGWITPGERPGTTTDTGGSTYYDPYTGDSQVYVPGGGGRLFQNTEIE